MNIDDNKIKGDSRLLEALRCELRFLEAGGYGNRSLHPPLFFRDSPTCLNYGDPRHSRPCSQCPLMELVPPEHQKDEIPCRQIRLNRQGDTIDSLYQIETQQGMEAALADWLEKTIRQLELAEK
jgi:hypothetical protein